MMNAKVRQKTLRLLSNGVYVLTSRSEDRYGAATVTWVSQALFKPPLLMVAVRRESHVFKCMTESRIAAHRGGQPAGDRPAVFLPDRCGVRNDQRRAVCEWKNGRAHIGQLARAHRMSGRKDRTHRRRSCGSDPAGGGGSVPVEASGAADRAAEYSIGTI
jgi:hypothetical protein